MLQHLGKLILRNLQYLCLIFIGLNSYETGHTQGSDAIRLLDISFGSPEAMEMAKYGNLDVSLFKGVPNVGVPLHSMNLPGFTLPISLNYDAGGVKVDQIATQVGLGWTLHAGGQITQAVYGLNDLVNSLNSDVLQLPTISNFNPNVWSGISDSIGLAHKPHYDLAWDMFRLIGPPINLKPDVFFYNYPGNSGRFVSSGPKEALSFHSVPFVDHSIIYSPSTGIFTVVDGQGNTFIFNVQEIATTKGGVLSCSGGLGGGGPISIGSQTDLLGNLLDQTSFTWHLGKIVTANKDTVKFTYTQLSEFTYLENKTRQKFEVQGNPLAGCPTSDFDRVCEVDKTVAPRVLQKIEWVRAGVTLEEVHFGYGASREDFGESDYRVLESVTVNRLGNELIRWDLNHAYFYSFSGSGQLAKRLRLNFVQQQGYPAYQFSYNTSGSLPHRGAFAQDHWGYYNGKNTNQSLVPHYTGSTGTGDRSVDPLFIGYWTLERIDWPTGGYTLLNMEGFNGGLRVKSIQDFDGFGGAINTREYTYPQVSYLGHAHQYIDNIETYLENDDLESPSCKFNSHSSGSVLYSGILDGPEVGFEHVTIDYGTANEGGRSVVEFSLGYSVENSNAMRWMHGERLKETNYLYNTDSVNYYKLHETQQEFNVNYLDQPMTLWLEPIYPHEQYIYGMDIRMRTPEREILSGSGGVIGIVQARFDVNKYRIVSAWYHPEYTRVYTHDPQNDALFMLTTTSHAYDSVSTKLSSVVETNSQGMLRRTAFTYGVPDKPSAITSVAVTDSADNLLQKRRAVWAFSQGSSRYERKEIYDFFTYNDSIRVAQYPVYDAWGNVLESRDARNAKTQYFYGNNGAPFTQDALYGSHGVFLTGIHADSDGAMLNSSARYDSLGRLTRLIDANGVSVTYGYDGLNRLTEVLNNQVLTNRMNYHIGFTGQDYGVGTDNYNRVKTTLFRTVSDSLVSIMYYDGLGRPIQSQSAIGGGDAYIQHIFYDNFGREEAVTNPIIWNSPGLDFIPRANMVGSNWKPGDQLSTGQNRYIYQYHYDTLNLSSDDSRYAYSQTAYYADPLGRVQRQAAPGYQWRMEATGSIDRTVSNSYRLNAGSNEEFLDFGGNKLHKLTINDENSNHSWLFTDGWGNTIAQVTDLNGDGIIGAEDIITRFKYDQLGNLTAVYEPNSYPDTLAYVREYSYDLRGRLTSMLSPDVNGSIDYYYNNAGDVRFTRTPEHKILANSNTNNYSYQFLNWTNGFNTFTFEKDGVLKIDAQFTALGYEEIQLRLFEISVTGPDAKVWESEPMWGWSNQIDIELGLTQGEYRFEIFMYYDEQYYENMSASIEVELLYNQFSYHKYDALGRVVESGLYHGEFNSVIESALSGYAQDSDFPTSDHTVLFQYSYDQADQVYPAARNLVGRVAKVSYLDMSSGNWGYTWYSYREDGLVEWVAQKLPFTSFQNKQTFYEHDRLGNITKITYQPSSINERIVFWYDYNDGGQLWKIYSNRNDDKANARLEAEYTYNASGQINQLALGGSISNGGSQLIDYKYNVRGLLNGINNPSNLSSPVGFADDRFAMHIYYEDHPTVGLRQYNGNISRVKWKTSPTSLVSNDNPHYDFSYDRANRLVQAIFGNTHYDYTHDYALSVRNVTYDLNGNFLTLDRYHDYMNGTIDELNYNYYQGSNQLQNTNGTSQSIHKYDKLGNMTSNMSPNRNIQSISYDGRNLAYRMNRTNSGNTESMNYRFSYDADGNRVAKSYRSDSGNSGYRYVRGADGSVIAVYNQFGTLQFWNIPGGPGRLMR